MYTRFACLFCIAIVLLYTLIPVQAREFHFGLGASPDPIYVARAAWRSDAFNSVSLPSWTGHPTLYAEASANHIRDSRPEGSNLTLVALSPVLQWQLNESATPLFIEAGIGVSLMDRTRAGGRRLSTVFQFEDIVRLSWQYSKRSEARLTAAYVHYSNAGLRSPNQGMNLFQLIWSRPL